MQDLLMLLVTIMFIAVGLVTPFVLSLGYIWVDVFTPHLISASLLAHQPIAFVMGAAAVTMYMLGDRRSPPRLNAILCLQILVAAWITCTLQWAVAPAVAAVRWDVAIKVCIFAIFVPFVFRSRVQIEAFVLVYVISIMGHIVPWGIKTFITGGGYQQALGLLGVNVSLLAESSSVSAVAVAVVPIILALRKHSVLLPKGRGIMIGSWLLIMISLVASIGTFARTALLAFGVTGGWMWLRSKRKVAFLLATLVIGGVMISVTSSKWTARIETVSDYQNENSAYIRILMWRWAMDFAQTHPFGGGFWSNVVSRIEVPDPSGTPVVQFGRAYHNIYFGVLADHGYLGLTLYLSLIGVALLGLRKARKLTLHDPEHVWCADLAQALQVGMATILAGGMFVEIGWTPIVWYLFSMAACLREYARRVTAPLPVSQAALVAPDRAVTAGL